MLFILYQTSTGYEIYRKNVVDLSLPVWKRKTEKRLLTSVRKEKYHTAIQKGDTIAGWADYDLMVKSLTPELVQKVMGEVEEGCRILLVQQGTERGIIVREGGQEKVVKGNVDRFKDYRILKNVKFSEVKMFNKQDEKLLAKWDKEYFK